MPVDGSGTNQPSAGPASSSERGDVQVRTSMLHAALEEVLELTSVGMAAYREALIAELDALQAA